MPISKKIPEPAANTADTRPLWGDLYPEIERGTIPVDYLRDERFFDLEREKIFRKCWLYVGRVEEITSPHGFIVKEIDICKTSVLIVRDNETKKLSAFYNICKHRLNKLVYEKTGSTGSFVCNYHGWAYDRKGNLRHIPDEAAFYGIKKSKCNLTSVAVDEWRGFIFINLDPTPEQTLIEYLEDVPTLLKDFPFEDLAGVTYGHTVNMEVNWKVGQQTNMESYHAAHLHIAPMIDSRAESVNTGNRPLNIGLMKKHRFFAFGAKREGGPETFPPTMRFVAECTGRASAGAHAPGGASNPEATMQHAGFPGTNFNNAEWWGGDNFFIFPNLLLATSAGFFQTLLYEPLTFRRSRFKNNFHYPKPRNARDLFAMKFAIVMQLYITAGDIWAGDRVQDGLETRVADEMYLNDSEILIRHEYNVYKKMLGL